MIFDNELMKNFEIQVRTKKMHRVAEEGSASHFRYKDKMREEENTLFGIMLDESIEGKAYDIWHKFQWSIVELAAYEEEIKEMCCRLKNIVLTEQRIVVKELSFSDTREDI